MATKIDPSVTAMSYGSDKYSDMVIACKGRKFPVHKVIVCMQSKVFAAAMDGSFKEANTSQIDLDDDAPEVVAQMIRWLYTHHYEYGISSKKTLGEISTTAPAQTFTWGTPTTPTTHHSQVFSFLRSDNPTVADPAIQTSLSTSSRSTPKISPVNSIFRSDHPPVAAPAKQSSSEVKSDTAGSEIIFHTQMYIIADKYDLSPLKTLAKIKYEAIASKEWNTPGFSASLQLVYEETVESDRMLKDVAIVIAGKHAKELLDRREFNDLCKMNGNIAYDVLKASVGVVPDSFIVQHPTMPWLVRPAAEHAHW